MATMKSPPMFIKLPKKRGTFFARKAGPSGDPDVENLLRGFDISLQASPLGVPTMPMFCRTTTSSAACISRQNLSAR